MQKSTPVSKSTPLPVLTVVTNASYGCSRSWKLMAFKTWYSPWHSSSTKSLWSPGYFSFQPSSWVKTFSQDFKLTLSCVTFFRILTTEVVMGSPSVQFIACISSWHSGWLEWCGKVVLFVCVIVIFVVIVIVWSGKVIQVVLAFLIFGQKLHTLEAGCCCKRRKGWSCCSASGGKETWQKSQKW